MSEWRPLGASYRVRLSRRAEQSAGGIWLPETMVQPASEGTVLGCGPGEPVPGAGPGYRGTLEARVGDVVLFEEHTLKPVGDGLEGLVPEREVAAVVIQGEPGVQPCGEWLLVEMERAATATTGGIEIPVAYRKKARCGRVLDCGLGRMRERGRWQGLRVSCAEIMGLPVRVTRDVATAGVGPWREESTVAGLLVYWEKSARLLMISGLARALALVRASEIMATDDGMMG